MNMSRQVPGLENILAGIPNWTGRISTVDLHVLINWDQVLLVLKNTSLQNKRRSLEIIYKIIIESFVNATREALLKGKAQYNRPPNKGSLFCKNR